MAVLKSDVQIMYNEPHKKRGCTIKRTPKQKWCSWRRI